MNAIRKVGTLVLLAAGCAAPTVGLAAPCSGTNVNETYVWEEKEIAEGTKLATWKAKSIVVSDDPSAPFHLVGGECIGSFLFTADGKSQGSGSCARKDKDGDILHETFVQPPNDGTKGTLTNVGGTGKFANARSTAQWNILRFYQPLSMAAVRWTGDCS